MIARSQSRWSLTIVLGILVLLVGLVVFSLPPKVEAANGDDWWMEMTSDLEGSTPIFRDKITNKNLYFGSFNNWLGQEYLDSNQLKWNNVYRFNGQFVAPSNGEYRFHIETNTNNNNVIKEDTVRLWVDGQLLIDTVGNPVTGATDLAAITLDEGITYDIRVELTAKSTVKQSNINLYWLKPGQEESTQLNTQRAIDIITAPDDESPPSTVTDATYGVITENAIEITWTAPGSDDIVLEGPGDTELLWGTVASYDIRYSTVSPGGELSAWWGNAIPVDESVIPTPVSAGKPQSMIVTGLDEDTTYYFVIKSRDAGWDGSPVWSDDPDAPPGIESDFSNVVIATTLVPVPDTTAPSAVSDLTATTDDNAKVTVNWTAPGDDGDEGMATSYDLRYSNEPITNDNWSSATPVDGLPAPQSAGSSESVQIQLVKGNTYYFALKTTDEVGNESDISNNGFIVTPDVIKWWMEITNNEEGNAPVFRDLIVDKNLSFNAFHNWLYFDYFAKENNLNMGHNVVRFNGQFVAPPNPEDDEYKFSIRTNIHATNVNKADTVRLWIDGQLLIDTVGNPINGTSDPVSINLVAGQTYDIRVELIVKSNVLQSSLYLYWQKGDGAVTDQIDIIRAPEDISPPTKINDADYGTISSSSVELTWTAPGSDDITLEGPDGSDLLWGTVASYDIRYSKSPVSELESWWEAATPVDASMLPAPMTAGSAQSMIVEGLDQETTYYFVIKSRDTGWDGAPGWSNDPDAPLGNESDHSNVVIATTLAPDLTAPSAVDDLTATSDASANITLTWSAPGDDGIEGTATSYDLRYSRQPITNDNWKDARVVSGLPVPQVYGTPQTTQVQLNWNDHYYFALKTTDKENNVSAISNIASVATPDMPEGIFGKIPLNPSMVYNELFPHLDFGAKRLVDEQVLVGDPMMGDNIKPDNSLHLGGAAYNPETHSIIIDLGEDYRIDYVYMFYSGGFNENTIEVSSGKPFHWDTVILDQAPNLNGDRWKGFDVRDEDDLGVTTRFLQIKKEGSRTRNIGEIVLYGTKLGTGKDVIPPRVERERPLMNEFIGANILRDDPLDAIAVVGNAREYHNMSLDSRGGGLTGTVNVGYEYAYPNNKMKFNPSNCCGDGPFNYDAFFKSVYDLGINIFPAVQGSVGWLSAEFGNKPKLIGSDPLEPASYIPHADHMFQVVARYGSNAVDPSLLKLDEGQPPLTGLGYMEYFENGNETNAHWGSRDIFSTPYELAAMLSADYDGHLNTMGPGVGVKNADPNAKLVMAGLAGSDLSFFKGIKLWADEYRGGDFPADVLNTHFYANETGWDQAASVIGISPEDFKVQERFSEMVEYRDRYIPDAEIWVSEFGYDTHPNSPQRAPAIGSYSQQEVQGQWLVRTYLALAAAGVDKAQMYMLRDVADRGGKFDTSGLVTHKGVWDKKVSWYYVYTLKNRLMGLKYAEDVNSGNDDVSIQAYENQDGKTTAYVVWAPTSNETYVNNYQLTLPAGTQSADLVEMVDKSTVGVKTALTIAEDGTVRVNVSERPVFIMLDGSGDLQMPEWTEVNELIASDITENELTLTWVHDPDSEIKWYQISKDGNGIASMLKANEDTSIHVTGLEAGTSYEFQLNGSIINGIWSQDGPTITVKTDDVTNPTAPADLTSNLVSDTKVSLFWNAATDNVAVAGYIIYANGQWVMTVDGEQTNAGVTGLKPNTDYEIVITAFDENGNESEPSNAILLKTEASPVSNMPIGGGAGANLPADSEQAAEHVVAIQPNPGQPSGTGDVYYVGKDHLTQALKESAEQENRDSVIEIDIQDASQPVDITIPLEPIYAAGEDAKATKVRVKVGKIYYELPASLLNIEKIASQLDAQINALSIRISIQNDEAMDAETKRAYLDQQGITVIGGAHTVHFYIEGGAKPSTGKTVTISAVTNFDSADLSLGYEKVDGHLTIDQPLNIDQVAFVKYNEVEQSFTFVPAIFTVEGDQTHIRFKSSGNGTYMVVERDLVFEDIDDSWLKSDIELLASKFVIHGYNNATFAPDASITRAEFASLIVQATGLSGISSENSAIYADIRDGEWYTNAIHVMNDTNMMIGFNGNFHPNGSITRQEAFVVMNRLLQFAGHPVSVSQADLQALKKFINVDQVSVWAQESVAALIRADILTAVFSQQLLAPKEHISREECALLLRKVLQYIEYIN